VPEETLNVLVGALAEGEIHVPRLGRIPAGGVPPDRGDEPVRRGRHRARPHAISDRMCRIAIGYQDAGPSRRSCGG
jgi:MoxR-like ATPase